MASYSCLCLFYLLIYLCTISTIQGALRPRGVSLPKKVFYNPNQLFHCLDGSGSFPFYFVNDDFCDCEDGSDEPGTSACPNGVFHCSNHGHVSIMLPSSRVNDGICDCCDTSDEYNSTVDCLNNCKELGQQALRAALAFKENFMKGQEIRAEYIKQGKEKKETYKTYLEELQKHEKEAARVKNEKEDVKENAETKENIYLGKEKEFKKAQEKRLAAEKQLLFQHQRQEETEGKNAFSELDLNKDGKLTASEVKSFSRFDYDQDGTVSDNEAQFYMHMKEEMSEEEFFANGWKVMKPAFTIEESEHMPQEPIDANRRSMNPTESDQTLQRESMSPSSVDERLEKDAILKDAAVARQDHADAHKLLRDIEAEIWHITAKIHADYGPESEFLVLENQCFELSDKKYLYKLCLFDKIVQVVKVNQDETLVGLWDKWTGPQENHYAKMRYSRGTSCWNGPNRSAEVIVKCGTENKVTSVEESSPCTYTFEFTTPAMCQELPAHIQEVLRNDFRFV